MKCLLFSGGWDCVAVATKLKDRSIDLLFFDYGQMYITQELRAAEHFAKEKGFTLVIRKIGLVHDMERRNFFFIMEAKRMGYQTIYTGNRNLAPIFDKYKDSNFFSIKLFAHLCNVKVKMPVLGWPKRRIVNKCNKGYSGTPYNCYRANDNYLNCECPNCKELQKILK